MAILHIFSNFTQTQHLKNATTTNSKNTYKKSTSFAKFAKYLNISPLLKKPSHEKFSMHDLVSVIIIINSSAKFEGED